MRPRGYGLAATGLALLAAGFWLGYPELAALGSASIVAVLGALVFVAWKAQLHVERMIEPDRVMRGEPSQVRLMVRNDGRLFGASLVARDRLRQRGFMPVPLVRLRPGRTTVVSYPVPTLRRGVLEIGPLEITRQDPLGLIGVVRRYGDSGTVWVRPKVHPIAAVPVGLSRSMDGRVDRVPHGSITFAALREYVVGDDLRRVHWRTSARVGELMVREHVDTSLPRVIVVLDDRPGAHAVGEDGESTFEAACEAAASVIVAGARAEVRTVLQTVSGSSRGAEEGMLIGAEVGPLLDLLAEASMTAPDGAETLQLAAQRLRLRRSGDTLLFLTGPISQEDLGVVAGLRGAYPSIIVGVFGRVESGLSTTAGLLVVGASDGADFAASWDGLRAW
jgi:uncharacterized protein (DUF58 family)